MIVAFRQLEHDAKWINKLESLWTNSIFTHAQIIFSNGDIGGSWMDTGVAFKTIKEVIVYPFLWTYIKIKCDNENEQLAYDFMKSKLGSSFDNTSYLLYYTKIPWLYRRKHAEFCSGFVFQALVNGGMIKKQSYLKYESVSPQNLYDILLKEDNCKLLKWNDSSIQAQYTR